MDRIATRYVPPFCVVPMPLDALGRGPADECDTVRTSWDVWDAAWSTVCNCYTEADAQFIAACLNAVAKEQD